MSRLYRSPIATRHPVGAETNGPITLWDVMATSLPDLHFLRETT
jgi:hypothetical protein